MSTRTRSLYGTCLDFSSVFPRLSRVQATLVVGVLSIAFNFIGRFGLNLVQSISTFARLIITCTTPWMVVMMIGVLFTDVPGQFVGPPGKLAGGVEISLPLSPAVAAVLFLALLRLFPEPRAAYGPQGARPARTVHVPVPAITGPGTPDEITPALAVEGG